MNIALGALIITILLLPGAFILRAYYTSFHKKEKGVYVPFAELLFKGLVASFLCHFVALAFLQAIGIEVDYQLIYQLATGGRFPVSNRLFARCFMEFCLYHVVLLAIVVGITKQVKRYLIRLNLDLVYQGLRASNFWFYAFSARTLERSRKGEWDTTDLLYVNVLSRKDVLYSGFLNNFEYSPGKDRMETITLGNASKRTYAKKENSSGGEQAPHPLKHTDSSLIRGNSFIILWDDILNINIHYVNLSNAQDDG